jgi:hypothetical protein
MKRDMDFVRDLLLRIEAGEKLFSWSGSHTGREHNPEEEKLGEHIRLLKQADFIDVLDESSSGVIFLNGLSWKGHDFLDSVRDPKIWEKTKTGAAVAGGFTVDLLKDLAKGLVKKQIEEFTGVKL